MRLAAAKRSTEAAKALLLIKLIAEDFAGVSATECAARYSTKGLVTELARGQRNETNDETEEFFKEEHYLYRDLLDILKREE